MTENLFLGLDSSTQALKASLLNNDLNVVSEIEVRFDRDVPRYGTKGGTLLGPSGSGIVYSPVMQLVEATDLLFDRMKQARWPVEKIQAVSAAGQQHASVYWSQEAEQSLANINPTYSLASQLNGAFTRQAIPNWQDSSTMEQCKRLEEAMGGPSILAQRTGSRAHTRFTGPQIMRFKDSEPEAYRNTSRVSLVSSFMTTILCLDGEVKGIDESDACGMNLWNMCEESRGWDPLVLEAIAGKEGSRDLERKLGKVETDGGRVVGHIGSYFVDKFGFSKDCIVCPGTGDNPATFLAFTLKEKEALISLGTSDTVLVSTSRYTPDPEYHAFFHPAQTVTSNRQEAGSDGREIKKGMRYFNMLVYKNGSLAREYIRDTYFDSCWDAFNAAVESNRPKEADRPLQHTGFYWLRPDIIPANASGIHKYSHELNASQAKKVDDFKNQSVNAIAILESQMMSYGSRVNAICGEAGHHRTSIGRVYATGGAASNPVICSVMSDVFDSDVCKPVTFNSKTENWENANWNACSVAAAYKAAWAWYRHTAAEEEQKWIEFDVFIQQCRKQRLRERPSQQVGEKQEMVEDGVAIVARPDKMRAQMYDKSIEWWKSLESRALEESRQACV